jgi:ABC-type polysaccharide/polyol phosphate transport system ATPase subunit
MSHIELDDVSVTFRVRPHGRVTLKEFLIRRLFRPSVNPVVSVHAIRDVSLRIAEGDRVGILGPNGAGKTTLLKVLAGIYPPSTGRRTVVGRVSSLFDIALGFEPEASGWDNIAYRCYLQGETPASVKAKSQEIADFSELGKFLDLPVRCYSAGMLVRLAFAVATTIEPEILLIDEVLSVGDLAFQQKARQRMQAMMAKARLMVVVSHDMESLAELCSKIVWMEQGRVREIGPPEDVIAAYTEEAESGAASEHDPFADRLAAVA